MNLAKIIAVLSAAAQLLPSVAAVVQSVESAFPVGSPGAVKLTAVQVTLESAYALIPGLEAAWEDVWPVVQKQISAIVAVYNAIGTFVHGTPAATTAAVAK